MTADQILKIANDVSYAHYPGLLIRQVCTGPEAVTTGKSVTIIYSHWVKGIESHALTFTCASYSDENDLKAQILAEFQKVFE